MSAEQAKRMRLSKNVDILHIRAIARLYDEQGYEVVELLKRSPAIAAPVLLMRLKPQPPMLSDLKPIQRIQEGFRYAYESLPIRSILLLLSLM